MYILYSILLTAGFVLALPWFLWKLWNIKVNHGITPDHQSHWQLTPAQVATIAGNPSIKMDLINREMATP